MRNALPFLTFLLLALGSGAGRAQDKPLDAKAQEKIVKAAKSGEMPEE